MSNVVQTDSRTRVMFAIGSMAGGGSERQLLNILRYLDRSRFVPFLYLIHRSGELLAELPPDVPVDAFSDRHPQPRGVFPGQIYRSQVRDLAQVLSERQVDVVYDRTLSMTLIAAPAARRAQVPRISVIVADPRQALERTAGRFQTIKRHLLGRAYLRAWRVLAVSHGVRDAAAAFYRLSDDQIAAIPNFLDLEQIDRSARQTSPLAADGRFHIVAAGRLEYEKGFDVLLEAIQDVVQQRQRRQVQLHILGQGSLEERLQTFIRTAELEEHVHLHGFVDNPIPYFRAAALFCLSSRFDGMPNALIEALICGTPVVSTDCPSGPREILADGKYGRLVPVDCATELADAIEDAILNAEQWSQVAASAREYARNTYSPTTGIRRVERLLAQAAGRDDEEGEHTERKAHIAGNQDAGEAETDPPHDG